MGNVPLKRLLLFTLVFTVMKRAEIQRQKSEAGYSHEGNQTHPSRVVQQFCNFKSIFFMLQLFHCELGANFAVFPAIVLS